MIQSGPEIGHWTAERLGTRFWDGEHIAIGLRRNGQIVAGVIYENYNGAAIMAHMVVEGKLTRDFIAAIFNYAYSVAGVKTVILPVTVANSRSVRLVEHMGFTVAATLTDCHPDGDLRLYTLSKTDCRFLGWRDYDRQESTQSAAAA